MTATRIVRAATLPAAFALWLLAAWLLWRTQVPDDLRLPHVDTRSVVPPAALARARRHAGFLRVDFLLALLAQLVVLTALAAAAPRLVRRLRGRPFLRALELGLVVLVAVWLARLPFGVAAHRWERRYGLDRRGWDEWLVARLPLGSAVALVVCLAIVLVLARRFGRRWWLPAAPLLSAAAFLVVWAGPLLGPTLHPLRDRALAATLRPAGVRFGVERLKKRRTANAEAIGIGSTRRIVFTSTLFDGRYGERELRVIARHELAHLERRHLLKGVAWFALFALPCAFALAWAGERRGGLPRPEAVPAVLLAAFCLQLVALPLGGAISRRYEAEADWIALERTRDPAAARALFAGFVRHDLDQPDPPRWAHLLLGDHPTLLERIEMAEAWRARRG